MGTRLIPPPDKDVQEIALRDALEERYLAYALSTIMHRALPDARDGLKPVHRRILYGMRLLRLDPGTTPKKSAKIVGDVMGNFHPHGDQAIYDALVRLAQQFAQRYPLVDGQGNFGNIDGDNAAAMRYTEARLTEVARLLIEGIDEDAVDFRATYDGTNEEPVVLPAAFPNLLANGSQGIAVGMATAIPPHNAAELCDAALDHRLDQVQAQWDPRAALGVVLAAGGYPDTVRKGDVIEGLGDAAKLPGKVFHAGTKLENGQVLTSGGRVLCAVGLGDTVSAAQAQAYALVDRIRWQGMQCRRDIGFRAIAREQRRQ